MGVIVGGRGVNNTASTKPAKVRKKIKKNKRSRNAQKKRALYIVLFTINHICSEITTRKIKMIIPLSVSNPPIRSTSP